MSARRSVATALLLLLVFILIAATMPYDWETALLFAVNARESVWQVRLAQTLHYFGWVGFSLPFTRALVIFFLLRRDYRAATLLAAGIALAIGISSLCKYGLAKARPDLWAPLAVQHDASFPSGHTTFASALATALWLIYPRAAWVFLLPLTMAYARLLLGVHFPSDVLAGLCLGAAAVLLVNGLWRLRGKGV